MTIEQAQKDLKTTWDDVQELKYLFKNYGYDPKFMGPNGVTFDLQDPTWLECMSVEKAVRQLLNKAADEKIAIIWVCASHGGQNNGLQTVVVNQYNKKTGYYKLWGVEYLIR